MSDAWFWEFDRVGPLGSAGWYPVLLCYDPNDGVFPGGEFWDGQKWRSPRAISCYMPVRYETEKEAGVMAYRHDPEL